MDIASQSVNECEVYLQTEFLTLDSFLQCANDFMVSTC